MARRSHPPGLLALLLHTLRTDVRIPRRVLLTWSGIDEKQYGRWVREGQRPDRRGREKLAVVFPHVWTYLERDGLTWDDVVDRLPEQCRYGAIRSKHIDENPLLAAADLDEDPARDVSRPEVDHMRHVLAIADIEEHRRATQVGFDLADLVHAVVRAVCVDDVSARSLTASALAQLPTSIDAASHIDAYRVAVQVVARERPAPVTSFTPDCADPSSFLAVMDPLLAVTVVLADQELLPLGQLAQVLDLHVDYVPGRLRLARRELRELGWVPR